MTIYFLSFLNQRLNKLVKKGRAALRIKPMPAPSCLSAFTFDLYARDLLAISFNLPTEQDDFNLLFMFALLGEFRSVYKTL
jgi:hypothetical protein